MSSLIAGSREPEDAKCPPAHSRIMQYRSVHSAQAIYTAVMDRLFGVAFRDAAKAADAVVGPAHYHIHLGGVLVKAPLKTLPEAGRTCVGMSRAAHETVLRSLVAKDAETRGIEFADGNVIGFDMDPQNPKRLKSIRYRDNNKGQSIVTLDAGLIIGMSTQRYLKQRSFLPCRLLRLLSSRSIFPTAHYAARRPTEDHHGELSPAHAIHFMHVSECESCAQTLARTCWSRLCIRFAHPVTFCTIAGNGDSANRNNSG
jgi:hypothetical protein